MCFSIVLFNKLWFVVLCIFKVLSCLEVFWFVCAGVFYCCVFVLVFRVWALCVLLRCLVLCLFV